MRIKRTRKGEKETYLATHSGSIQFTRNPNCYIFTNESQKTGSAFVYDFPWKKKDLFGIAQQILADRYFGGDVKGCKEAMIITSITKHCYPKNVTIYP